MLTSRGSRGCHAGMANVLSPGQQEQVRALGLLEGRAAEARGGRGSCDPHAAPLEVGAQPGRCELISGVGAAIDSRLQVAGWVDRALTSSLRRAL